MKRLLDMPVRDALRSAACYTFVGVVLWLPVIVKLLQASP